MSVLLFIDLIYVSGLFFRMIILILSKILLYDHVPLKILKPRSRVNMTTISKKEQDLESVKNGRNTKKKLSRYTKQMLVFML